MSSSEGASVKADYLLDPGDDWEDMCEDAFDDQDFHSPVASFEESGIPVRKKLEQRVAEPEPAAESTRSTEAEEDVLAKLKSFIEDQQVQAQTERTKFSRHLEVSTDSIPMYIPLTVLVVPDREVGNCRVGEA